MQRLYQHDANTTVLKYEKPWHKAFKLAKRHNPLRREVSTIAARTPPVASTVHPKAARSPLVVKDDDLCSMDGRDSATPSPVFDDEDEWELVESGDLEKKTPAFLKPIGKSKARNALVQETSQHNVSEIDAKFIPMKMDLLLEDADLNDLTATLQTIGLTEKEKALRKRALATSTKPKSPVIPKPVPLKIWEPAYEEQADTCRPLADLDRDIDLTNISPDDLLLDDSKMLAEMAAADGIIRVTDIDEWRKSRKQVKSVRFVEETEVSTYARVSSSVSSQQRTLTSAPT